MSAVSSVDSGVAVGAGCVEAVDGWTLTGACALPLAATAVAGVSPWLVGAAGVDVTAKACGAGVAVTGAADDTAFVGAGGVTVAERTLAVTLPEPAELVVDPAAGVVGAACADTLVVVFADTGALLALIEAVAAATEMAGLAGAATGWELMTPPATAGVPLPPVAAVMVGASGTPVDPCDTVTVKGCVALD
jgi:hypothetical protein